MNIYIRANTDRLNGAALSRNPAAGAVALLQQYPDFIHWDEIGANPNPDAIALLRAFCTEHQARGFCEASVYHLQVNKLCSNPTDDAMALLHELLQDPTYGPTRFRYLNWAALSSNPHPYAFRLLQENPAQIRFDDLCMNTHPDAIDLLLHHHPSPQKDYGSFLSSSPNPAAIALLSQSDRMSQYIDWFLLSSNPCHAAMQLLQENPDLVHFFMMSDNCHPEALRLLQDNPEWIQWDALCSNTNEDAVALVLQHAHPDTIRWPVLSANPSNAAVTLLDQHRDRIDWYFLSMNPNESLWWPEDICGYVFK